jgi:hypothetical protein
MWEKIKKWFGFADLNKDGKFNAKDLEVAKAVADKNIKEVNETINLVKEEVADVVEAAKEVIDQAEDVAAAVKGKPRRGRKKKA